LKLKVFSEFLKIVFRISENFQLKLKSAEAAIFREQNDGS